MNSASRARTTLRALEILDANDGALDATFDATERCSEPDRDQLLKARAHGSFRVNGKLCSHVQAMTEPRFPNFVELRVHARATRRTRRAFPWRATLSGVRPI